MNKLSYFTEIIITHYSGPKVIVTIYVLFFFRVLLPEDIISKNIFFYSVFLPVTVGRYLTFTMKIVYYFITNQVLVTTVQYKMYGKILYHNSIVLF